MRIGFDAKRLFFNNSGLGNYSRSTVRLLEKYYPENRYLLFSPRKGAGAAGFQLTDRMEIVYPRGIAKFFPSVWRSYAMGSDIRKHKLDLYHGLSNELPNDVKKSGAKSIVTIHDLIFIRYPELYKPLDRAIYIKKYRRSCDLADGIIAISNQTKEDLMNYWSVPESKIEVIYQGCDPTFAVKVTEAKKEEVRRKYVLPQRFILGVGTIEERKNLLLTLRAMVAGKIDIDLVACGRHTPYADLLAEFARKHGIGDRLHMIHNCSFEDLPAIYQMSTATVYTSVFEGFGIPILEAMNSGVPVITTAGGVFGETGGNAALYVDADNAEQMAETLNKVLSDPETRNEAIVRGYLHAAKFTEEVIAANLMKFYRSML